MSKTIKTDTPTHSSIWDYKMVTVEQINEIHEIGFGFENVEVFSINQKAIESLYLGQYDRMYTYRPESRPKNDLHEIFNHVRLVLKKSAMEDSSNVDMSEMFGQSEDENIEYLHNHFSSPDIVGLTLFDKKLKYRADFYVSWSNDDEYLNTDVTITEQDKTITIEIKKPGDN